MKTFNSNAHLTDATATITKQLVYNRLFWALSTITIIPSGSDLETLAYNDIQTDFARAILKSLEKRGNTSACDLLRGVNSPYCLEDVSADVLLWFSENVDRFCIDYENNRVAFADDSALLDLYRAIYNKLYAQKTRCDRVMPIVISVDGEEIDRRDISGLYDAMDTMDYLVYTAYRKQILDRVPFKHKELAERVLALREVGYKFKDIAPILATEGIQTTDNKVRYVFELMRTAYNDIINEERAR